MTTYLITGAAGFIGYHLAKTLASQGKYVLGVDNLNDYYSVQLKRDRLTELASQPSFSFTELELADREAMQVFFQDHQCDVVLHMAAQAGVRYSLENPHAYVDSNLVGFVNVLEGCRASEVKHLVYASSSSVYGASKKIPFSTKDFVDHPVSLYAATKKANELIAHSYSHLFDLPTTGLRLFTVYGPWGRPDMALYKFAEAISRNQPIEVYNHGNMRRDFTYIDDIVEGVLRVAEKVPEGRASNSEDTSLTSGPAPYKIYNIGNNQPVELEKVISVLEACLRRQAQKVYLPMQPGDVPETYADIDDLAMAVDFRPDTSIEVGVARFIDWYKWYSNRV